MWHSQHEETHRHIVAVRCKTLGFHEKLNVFTGRQNAFIALVCAADIMMLFKIRFGQVSVANG